MEINEIELASELAHERMIEHWDDTDDIYTEDTEGCMVYTEIAQDFFNDYYDYYLTLIEKIKL